MNEEKLIEFGTWVQDNFSQNVKQGSYRKMLPKGTMRRDFTDDHIPMSEIVTEFKNLRGL
jgi:hypothetical protein